MTSEPEGTLSDALVAVHDLLVDASIDHALCGGLAANLYREEVRATADVDLYLVIGAARLVQLTRSFEDAGWRAHPAWQRPEQLRLGRDDLPRVDCLIAGTDFERQAVRNAVGIRIAERDMKVLTPEDLIVLKLVAGRARDYEAVAAVMNARGGDLDIRYVERKLEGLGMRDRWDRALEEAEREADGSG